MSSESLKALLQILVADPAVTAIVGAGTAARVSPLVRTQDTPLPAVTLIRTAIEPVNLLNGSSGFDHSTVQVDCWDNTYRGARALADACRAAIEAAGSIMTSELDNFDASAELSGLYCVTQEFSVWL